MYIPSQISAEVRNDPLRTAASRRALAAVRREQAAYERDRVTARKGSGLRRRAAREFARRTIVGAAA